MTNPLTLDWHAIDAWWWPLVFILVGGFLANDVWRFLGVAFAGRLREDTEVFAYVKAVATALVAGVIAQLVLYPTGNLALTPMWLRIASVGVGFAAFRAARGSVLVGVLAGEAFLIGVWILAIGAPA